MVGVLICSIIMVSRSSGQRIAALDATKRGQCFARSVWIAKLQCCGPSSAVSWAVTSFDAFDGLILCLTPPFRGRWTSPTTSSPSPVPTYGGSEGQSHTRPNSASIRPSAKRNSRILKATALLPNQFLRINRASRSGPSAQTGFGRQSS